MQLMHWQAALGSVNKSWDHIRKDTITWEDQENKQRLDNDNSKDHAVISSSDSDYHLQLCWFLSPNDRSELLLKWTAVFKAGSGRDPIESIQVYKRIES